MATNEAERRRWNDAYFTSLWPKRERLTDRVTGYLLEALALQPGERVLDVGCGGGKTSIEAAHAVGPGGSVVGADVSVQLNRLATQRAEEAGVENVAVPGRRRADRPDRGRAVRRRDEPVRRDVLRRAGHGVREHPGAPRARRAARVRLLAVGGGEPVVPVRFGVADFVPPPPEPEPGKSRTGPFAFADPERTAGILESAGFVDVVRDAHALDVDVPEDSVVDEAQLTFMGVQDDLPAASEALDAYMAQFRLDSGLSRFPLRFQIFQATAG